MTEIEVATGIGSADKFASSVDPNNENEPAVIWHGQAILGEGPVWDPRDQHLWFVDIKKSRVYTLDPISGQSQYWVAPAQIGWVLPAARGGFLAGVQGGLYHFQPELDQFTLITPVEAALPKNRLNDATISPDGRVWFGTMDDACKVNSGSVYLWHERRLLRTAIPKVAVTNGPGISPDGKTLYHVDSKEGIVMAIQIGASGLTYTSCKEFIRLDPEEGSPDGVIVDSLGNLWLGVWGGFCARQYDPTGKLLRQVDLPVANVTKVALGGPELRTAFVTTARTDLSPHQLDAQPLAGDIFSFEVDVPGQSLPLVAF